MVGAPVDVDPLGSSRGGGHVERADVAAVFAGPEIVPSSFRLRAPITRPRLSSNGTALKDIAGLVGHRGTATTETVYRKVIVPELRRGAEVMGPAIHLTAVCLTAQRKVPWRAFTQTPHQPSARK